MIRYIYSALIALFINFSFCSVDSGFSYLQEAQTASPKKKILVFTSKGGGGHTAVCNALKKYLDGLYDLQIVNLFEEVLPSVDTMRIITFGKVSGEDFYNFCLQSRLIGLVNHFSSIGAWGIRRSKDSIESLIYDFIAKEKQKPDLIVSVMPMINCAILDASKRLELPFLILTNDLDTTNYINGIEKVDYDKFYYTLAFDDKDMKAKLKPAKIKNSSIKITGFPLRPDFFEKKDKALIKKKFELPSDKPILMILMGGAGSHASFRYVKNLAKIHDIPMHLVVCLGRNESLRKKINKINLPKNITISIIGFTDRISDLMAVSDLIITKTGPGSICEALALNLPMLLDVTSKPIWWEKMNIDFVVNHQFGDIIKNFRSLPGLVSKYLKDKRNLVAVKNRMLKFKKSDFGANLKKLLSEIIPN